MEISLKEDGGLRVVWADRGESSNNEVNKNKNLLRFTPQILSHLAGAKAWVIQERSRCPKGPLFHVIADGCAVLVKDNSWITSSSESGRGGGSSTSVGLKTRLTFGGDYCVNCLDFYCGIDESEGSAAEGFVFPEDQGEVATNLGVRHRDGD